MIHILYNKSAAFHRTDGAKINNLLDMDKPQKKKKRMNSTQAYRFLLPA